MKPKNQRLVLVVAAIVALLIAVLLGMWGLREKASYFYTPVELRAGKAKSGEAIRLGGIVERGSVKHYPSGGMSFVVTDGSARVLVWFDGIPPDLFREGSGVVADGRWTRGEDFVADTILAKHDERYMPPELGNLAAEHKAGKTLER